MQALPVENDIFTRHEAADYMKICLRALDENVANGRIKVIRIGRSIRIRRSALDKFLDDNESSVIPKTRAARK